MRKTRWITSRNRTRAVLTAATAVTLLLAYGVEPVPASFAAPTPPGVTAGQLRARHGLGAPAGTSFVPAKLATATAAGLPANPVAAPAPVARWPQAATSLVALAATPAGAGVAGPWVAAGTMPVRLSAAPAAAGAEPVASVRVRTAAHAAALAAGASAVLFTLARTDGVNSAGSVRVRLDYSGFADAYGGGYGARLTFVRMPACALTTPSVPACRTTAPVPTSNDATTRSLTAQVDVGSATTGATVLAATATASGGTGDYKATSLTPASSWQVNAQTGDFTWSYPLRTPPPIGGAAPMLALSYDSGASDGETAQDNSQPGQIGEGFGLVGGGFIERKYASCADHVGDTSNTTNQKNKTGDLCWDGQNAYLSLDGRSSEIIQDASSGKWRLASDDGSVIKQLTNTSNGAYGNQYWEVITSDGTQYYFGMNELPGWVSGDRTTNSAWTVPVVGLKTGDPCHNSSYASAACKNMAWRWNLDLVVDPNNNATEYFYNKQTNYYAFDSTATATGTKTQYTSGGTLAEIDYGSQMPNVYNRLPIQVVFGYVDRCTSTDQSTCAANENGTYWPDTPWDLYCSSTATCTGSGHQAPAFFDTLMLSSVTTRVYEGSTAGNVPIDTWTLGHQWLSAEVNDDLFLSSITHTGDVGGTVKLSPVTFGAIGLINRVPGDNYPAMTRYRIDSVTTESGEQIDVNYYPANCGSSLPTPSTDTLPCFEQKWSPGDLGDAPVTSWFYKYLVQEVDVVDSTGGEPVMPTYYTYVGGAAWHYDTDIDLVPTKDKGYAQWRGYEHVQVVAGASPNQSETDYTFMRGMDQNPMPDGTFASASVQDSRKDPSIPDANADNGFQLEKITYDGLNTAPQVDDEISTPWLSSATATTAVQPWGQTLTAQLHGTAQTDTYTTLASGATRHVKAHNTFDSSTGLVTKKDDYGDVSDASQALCTTTTYAQNSGANILDTPSEIKVTGGTCAATSPPLISDTRNDYDGQAFGAAPTAGNVTETDVWSAGDPGVTDHWVPQSRTTYDSYGRVLTSENAANATTSTSYTSSYGTGRATTQTTVTDPLGHQTVTSIDPAWGSPTEVKDPNNEITTRTYDALGRVTAAWLPGQSQSAGDPANYLYSYTETATAPATVTTKHLLNSASKLYLTTVEIYDAQLRLRQTQTPAEGVSGGTEVSDVFYDSRGNTVTANGPYPISGALSTTLYVTTQAQVPNATVDIYDGADRLVEQDTDSYGALKWKATWSYPGADEVTEIPPAGGTITTRYTDARGNTTAIDQYHSATAPTGAYDTTSYTYSPTGQLTGIADNAGNTWTDSYDLLGREISATGPDTGTTTSTYNDLGLLTSATGATGKTLSLVYDKDGRKTYEYDTTGGAAATSGDEVAHWTYDSPAIGQPATATRYVGGTGGEAYTETVNSYDPSYQPTSITIGIPTSTLAGSLAGSYTFSSTYNPDGTVASQSYPAAGGLPAETVYTGYDNLGSPYSMFSGLSDYVEQSFYAPDASPVEVDLGTAQSAQWSRMLYTYDAATGRLTGSQVQRQSANWANAADVSYGYDNLGNVTSASDSVSSDTQCFTHDYDQRLLAAWAQSSATCPASPPGASGIGGPAPYQETFSYDGAGLGIITGDTLLTPSGSTTTTPTYPAAGAPAPHAATKLTATAGSTVTTTNQTWTAAGQLATSATGGTTLTYNWNDPGQLDSITSGGTTIAAYRYDADGNLLLNQDAGTTTLYLPGEELAASGGTVAATRYYTHDGQVVAARTPSGLVWLVADPQGTDTLDINASTQAVTQRRFLPFGASRGSAPVSWPGNHGFVGGTTDPGTGLTNLGVREYNPANSTFISPDSILDPHNPQDLDPYSYGADNPTTNSDPSGQMFIAGGGCIGSLQFCEGAGGGGGSRGYQAPVPYALYYVPPPSIFLMSQAPPPRPKPVHRPANRPTGAIRFGCNSRVGLEMGNCIPPPMPKSGPVPKWLLWGGLVVLTVINVVQLGADPVTDTAEGADVAALAGTAVDDAATAGGDAGAAGGDAGATGGGSSSLPRSFGREIMTRDGEVYRPIDPQDPQVKPGTQVPRYNTPKEFVRPGQPDPVGPKIPSLKVAWALGPRVFAKSLGYAILEFLDALSHILHPFG